VKRLAAIVVNHGRADLLGPCLRSIESAARRASVELELVVVDNASTDGSVELVRRDHPAATLVEMRENIGFGGGVNAGLAASTGDWVLLLNNDATLDPEALRHLLAAATGRDVGAVAAQMRFAADRTLVNSAGLGVDVLGIAFDRLLGAPADGAEAQEATEVFGASAGAALYRRAMLDGLGGFDERFFVYLEDVDIAWRARIAGWRTLYEPRALAWHHHAATARHGSPFKYFHVGRNRVRMLARNADRRHLLRHGAAMLGYDLAYVAYVAATDRTLAPARGRVHGLREWRAYRREGAAVRRPVELAPRAGLRAALRRRATWRRGGSVAHRPVTP